MPQRNRSKKDGTLSEDGTSETTIQDENFQATNSVGNPAASVSSDDNNAVLQAISGMKTEFSSKLDGVLMAINSIKNELMNCQNRIAETEERISTTEDEHYRK